MKLSHPVVPEGPPLGVDDHVLLPGEVLRVEGLYVLDILQVASIGSCPQDQTNPAPVVSPGTAGKTIFRNIEDDFQTLTS